MATRPANLSDRQADLRGADSVLAATAQVAIAAVTWLSGAQGLLGYVWLDVAAVHFVATLPLAIAACMWVSRRDVSAGLVGFGAVGLTAVVPWIYIQARCRHDVDQLRR